MRPRRDGCDSRYYVGDGAKMNSFFRELKQRKIYPIALGYAVVALGDKERAIDEMERAYRDRAGNDIVPGAIAIRSFHLVNRTLFVAQGDHCVAKRDGIDLPLF